MAGKLHITITQGSDKGPKLHADFFGANLPEDSLLDSKAIAVAYAMGCCANAREASEHYIKGFLADCFSHPGPLWKLIAGLAIMLNLILIDVLYGPMGPGQPPCK